MGILAPKQQKSTTGPTKRRSAQLDFGQLAPLKPGGTVGFSSFRDQDPSSSRRNKARKKSNGSAGGAMDEDSDEEDEDAELIGKMEDVDDKDVKTMLNPDDAKYQGELADGVGRIKVMVLSHTQQLSLTWIQLKRQHSAEPLNSNSRRSPGSIGTTSVGTTPPADVDTAASANAALSGSVFGGVAPDDSVIGSPLKRHRASVHDMDHEAMQKRLGAGFAGRLGDVVAAAEAAHTPPPEPAMKDDNPEEDL